ncbi:hypothetical protein PybrP1_001870 [[Pythium] brassicae (nom. inval.)]|nr:hypothetical protein PybrP1_001870 [[Pythium] brassicae (nom. inval.)]
MTFSEDFRWRAIVLLYVYSVAVESVALWLLLFESTGTVRVSVRAQRESRWSTEVLGFVESYTASNPRFYFEELSAVLHSHHPIVTNLSDSTICRALRFDLGPTRKKLTKRAREMGPLSSSSWTRPRRMGDLSCVHTPDRSRVFLPKWFFRLLAGRECLSWPQPTPPDSSLGTTWRGHSLGASFTKCFEQRSCPTSARGHSRDLSLFSTTPDTHHHANAAFRVDPLAVIEVVLKACTFESSAENTYRNRGYLDNELSID